ncbi:hypothetical protein CEXT_807341 [Caerostris extrusa]|uniref:Secreted protein n=1 Tax=Caerostris extrusa TaxID=172846 RepID=A0AAV4XI93_CAEEX|nr:hypothetical protein CEXT_807341 [Caerostris extrusa]
MCNRFCVEALLNAFIIAVVPGALQSREHGGDCIEQEVEVNASIIYECNNIFKKCERRFAERSSGSSCGGRGWSTYSCVITFAYVLVGVPG